MQIDQTTLTDLAILNINDEDSIFHKFNYTQTNGGKLYLHYLFTNPLSNIQKISDTQNTLKHLHAIKENLPDTISNGTIMVMEKFYDSALNSYPSKCNSLNCFLYSVFSKADYALSKYSLQHFVQFIKGIKKIQSALNPSNSQIVNFWVEKIDLHTKKRWVDDLASITDVNIITKKQVISLSNHLRNSFKQDCFELIEIYCQIDAYLSVVETMINQQYSFPVLHQSEHPVIRATQLKHPLLLKAIAYDVELKKEENFLFLTGANMAGKSTFIKAIGVSVYLSHLGFPVPCKNLQLSYFDGLLSNINIVDNIFKNESYFFNEVKRIKSTVEKVNDKKNWLILIDELFKGTNIQDAMKCSLAVIKGLQKKQNALFVLSTHLYEIGEELKLYNNIQFKYFETAIENGELLFNYQLKSGISNDKLGYLILEREGVVDILK